MHADAVWENLLRTGPDAVLTPFTLGRHKIPDEDERAIVKARAARSYITSGAGSKPQLETSQVKRLGDIVTGLKPVNNGFGAVRSRKTFGGTTWDVQCFGDAKAL